MSGVEFRTVESDDADSRLDRWFRRHYPDLSHGRLEKFLRTGQVRLDGRRAKASVRITEGQTIRVPPNIDTESDASRPTVSVKYQSTRITGDDVQQLRSQILYRDAAFIALNKPAGLAVQGGSGVGRHVDAMLDALRFGAVERPRLAHRLDKDTSGVLLIGRTAKATAVIAEALRHRKTRKIYWAVVVGIPNPREGMIDIPLAKQRRRGRELSMESKTGKPARTGYKVVDAAGRRAAWVELSPETGRTHQLRAHLAEIGNPIMGDGKYGGKGAHVCGLSNQLHLHAKSIEVPLPEGKWISVSAPLPAHMVSTWEFFGFSLGIDSTLMDN